MAAPLRKAEMICRNLNRLLTVTRSSDILFNRCHKLSTSAGTLEKWKLMSAVCVERFPLITQEPTDLEKKYAELLENIEVENSLLSDHELRHRDDMLQAERRKQEDYEETEAEAVKQTALEAEDLWEAEHHNFTAASRLTDADKTDDRKSLERKLDRKLVLMVKQKLGDQSHWVLPQGDHQPGESMRESAERVLHDLCGDQLDVRLMGNVPCGYFKYNFNTESEGGYTGAKVFFFKAQISKGQVNENKDQVSDHLWLTKDEMNDYATPSYGKVLSKFIVEL